MPSRSTQRDMRALGSTPYGPLSQITNHSCDRTQIVAIPGPEETTVARELTQPFRPRYPPPAPRARSSRPLGSAAPGWEAPHGVRAVPHPPPHHSPALIAVSGSARRHHAPPPDHIGR